MTTFICSGCKTDSGVEQGNSFNVGKVEGQTGFKIILHHDGNFSCLCPKCLNSAQENAINIMNLVGTAWVSLQHLIPKELRID